MREYGYVSLFDTFQFLIVRLKVQDRQMSYNNYQAFQFLIVRLKVRIVFIKIKLLRISIPYSTIKSLKFVLKIFLIFKTLFFTKIRKINRKNVDLRS